MTGKGSRMTGKGNKMTCKDSDMLFREAVEDEKEKWNEFIRREEGGSFLQSWEWTDFMATQKKKIWRLVVEEKNEWLSLFFIFKSKLKLGVGILYGPRGPVISEKLKVNSEFNSGQKSKIFQEFVESIDAIAEREEAMWFQVDPMFSGEEWRWIFNDLGFVKSEHDIQPRHTLILDIRKSEEELLGQMHQKTRYNISVARKHQVEIAADNSLFKEFYELLKNTEARQKIKLFDANYFKNILQVPFVKLYAAKRNGRIIAANIMVFWNDTATYLFGASDYNERQAMAPHLLQWQAIKDAKDAGMWFYDFWGAAPRNARGREENWAGFTRFKMGFSPNAEITEYAGTYEKIYQPVKAGLYRFLQKFYR